VVRAEPDTFMPVRGVSDRYTWVPNVPDRARYGGDRGHAIEWIGVPAEAAELLLVCEDPDARGGAVLHWLVTGISAHAPGVAENSTPLDGREWLNDFGEVGWCGPAPRGDQPHRYLFHLFALSEPITSVAGSGYVDRLVQP
jgi:hypothetical protein